MDDKKWTFVADMTYKGKTYTIHMEFDSDYSYDDVMFMFEEGNYSCDCNRSLFIREEYGNVIRELDCGELIGMSNCHIEGG